MDAVGLEEFVHGPEVPFWERKADYLGDDHGTLEGPGCDLQGCTGTSLLFKWDVKGLQPNAIY